MDIKEIKFIPAYSCYGCLDELSYVSIYFKKDKLTYIKTPLKESNKNNYYIKVSYNPNNESIFNNEDYSYYFNKLIYLINELKNSNKAVLKVCDAISDSIKVTYENNKTERFNNIFNEDIFNEIRKISYKFATKEFKEWLRK